MESIYATIGLIWGGLMLLLGLGLGWALRPWGPSPSLRPWVASYLALGLVLVAAAVLGFQYHPLLQAQQRLMTLGLVGLGTMLSSALQLVGWGRLLRPELPLGWAFLPLALFILLAPVTGAYHHHWPRILLNTGSQTLLNLAMAYLAFRGLKARGGSGRVAIPGVLLAHALFNLARGIMAILSPKDSDQFLLVLMGVSEALVFYLILAYLQWLILSEDAEG
jgi:hypothetical protein